MQVTFYCIHCRKKFSVSDEMAGKRIRCKDCRHEMVIPEESELEEVVEPWVVECDECGRSHKPRDEHEGKRIRCKCGEVILLTRGEKSELRVQEDPAIDLFHDDDLAGAMPELNPLGDPYGVSGSMPQAPAYAPGPAMNPNHPGQVPPPNFSAPQTRSPVNQSGLDEQRRLKKEREDKLLGRLEEEDAFRRPNPGGGEMGDGWFNSGVAGGLALIFLGAVWLVVGLSFEILFYFPIFMIIAGVVSMIQGMMSVLR